MKMQQHIKIFSLLGLWSIIGIVGRLAPHLPNMTPLTSLSLLAGIMLNRRQSFLIVLLSLFISDTALSFIFNYPIFGSWSLFTYSGFLIIAFFGSRLTLTSKFVSMFLTLIGSSLFFWSWTNFGVWLLSGMYAHTMTGLIDCYVIALPFLRNALLGSAAWFLILFSGFIAVKNVGLFGKERIRIVNRP